MLFGGQRAVSNEFMFWTSQILTFWSPVQLMVFNGSSKHDFSNLFTILENTGMFDCFGCSPKRIYSVRRLKNPGSSQAYSSFIRCNAAWNNTNWVILNKFALPLHTYKLSSKFMTTSNLFVINPVLIWRNRTTYNGLTSLLLIWCSYNIEVCVFVQKSRIIFPDTEWKIGVAKIWCKFVISSHICIH